MPSSLWPLPSTPARPTISPGRISRVKLSSRTAPWRSCTVRPSQTRAKPFGRIGLLDGWRLVGLGERHVERAQLAADHGMDQRAHVGVGHALVGDQPAGAQHGDAIGDLGDLGELVRHQDDGAAGIGDAAADVEQARRSRRAAARRSARRAPAAWDRASGTSRSRRAGARRPRARRPRASGSRAKPKLSAMSRMRAPNSWRFSTPLTWPSIRFSTTVMRGTRLKCWCTMAMPFSSASAGLSGAQAAPSKAMSPAVGS